MSILKKLKRSFFTKLYYILIGIFSFLALLLLYYRILLSRSNFSLLLIHNSNTYIIFYILLTVCTALFFGINVSMLVYQIRKYGLRNIFPHTSGGAGALVGIIASSCPVCGSTILAGIGIIGSLSSLPFRGLEIKAISLILIALSVLISYRWLQKKGCNENVCPPELDDSFKKSDRVWLTSIVLSLVIFLFFGFQMIKSDPYFSGEINPENYSCQNRNF